MGLRLKITVEVAFVLLSQHKDVSHKLYCTSNTVEVVFCAAFAQIRSFGVNYINSKLGVNYINSKLNSVGERKREREREIVI